MSGTAVNAPLRAAAGAGLMMALLLPISRGRLEANLVGHVLVQMPLLVSSGWFLGSALEPKFHKVMERWNRFGVAGLTLTIFTVLFWILS